MSDVDTNGGKRRRRNKRWPEALKREIVAATRLPGSSVSVVARQYDVNANQIFRWRRIAETSPSTYASGEGRLAGSVAIAPTLSRWSQQEIGRHYVWTRCVAAEV